MPLLDCEIQPVTALTRVNWGPTDPKQEFELLFRFYGEEGAVREEWKLLDVKQVN